MKKLPHSQLSFLNPPKSLEKKKKKKKLGTPTIISEHEYERKCQPEYV